jgi:hypothetical protein
LSNYLSMCARSRTRSPVDVAVAPNGNIVVSNEHPFGVGDVVTSAEEYSAANRCLIRVFSAGISKFR